MREGYIPYGAYWSTPFARWQGSFAHLHALKFDASTAKAELARRNIPPQAFDYAVLGTTIPQHGSFYGVPWVMGMIGNDRIGGPSISQACATGVRTLLAAKQEIAAELAETVLVITADRCSRTSTIQIRRDRAGPAPMRIGCSTTLATILMRRSL